MPLLVEDDCHKLYLTFYWDYDVMATLGKAINISELGSGDDIGRMKEYFAISSEEKEQVLEAFLIIRRVLDSEIGAGP
jgi:hypothetical protein